MDQWLVGQKELARHRRAALFIVAARRWLGGCQIRLWGFSRDAVICYGGMWNICACEARHMAASAGIFPRLLLADSNWQAAARFLMTSKAAAAIVGRLFCRGRLLVRVVAGNAAKLTRAGPEASASEHLLDLADGRQVLVQLGRFDEHRPKQFER